MTSRSRPPYAAAVVAHALEAEAVQLGSAGAKAMSVVTGDTDIYVHDGGMYQWDSAAPAAVALAAGLHVSRIDGSPIVYNGRDPWLPDLLLCRPEWAAPVLDALWAMRRARHGPTGGVLITRRKLDRVQPSDQRRGRRRWDWLRSVPAPSTPLRPACTPSTRTLARLFVAVAAAQVLIGALVLLRAGRLTAIGTALVNGARGRGLGRHAGRRHLVDRRPEQAEAPQFADTACAALGVIATVAAVLALRPAERTVTAGTGSSHRRSPSPR